MDLNVSEEEKREETDSREEEVEDVQAAGSKQADNLSDSRNDTHLETEVDSNEVEMKSATEILESDNPPHLTDTDTDDQLSDGLSDQDQSSTAVIFKRRKLSNSRVYRRSSNNNQEEEEPGASGVSQMPELAEPSDEESIPELESTAELDESSSDSEVDAGEAVDVDISALAREICSKTPALPRHSLLRDLHHAKLGRQLRPSLRSRLCGSLDMVTRLHMVSKLSGHEGCVNSVSFNRAGDRIASGSDDLHIIVHDWQRQSRVVKFNTGHRANVFQSKILPGDLLITSCSRDGQVRLAELSVSGALRSTRKLAQHKVRSRRFLSFLTTDCMSGSSSQDVSHTGESALRTLRWRGWTGLHDGHQGTEAGQDSSPEEREEQKGSYLQHPQQPH